MPLIRGYYKEKTLGDYAAGVYKIHAQQWRTRFHDDLSINPSFKISIQDTRTGEIWLLQKDDWNEQNVQEVANAIGMLLGDNTQSYTPEGCMEMFT